MSDVFEIIITEQINEVVLSDPQLEIVIEEDFTETIINNDELELVMKDELIEVLTIAEQGPAGPSLDGITIGPNPPANPEVGHIWLDTDAI